MSTTVSEENATNKKWQLTLLPFMSKTIIILSAFFFLASLGQLIYLHIAIQNRPTLNMQETLAGLQYDRQASQKELIETARLKALVTLEASSFQNQYHQANVLLMGRLWTNYIGFVTGMILAVVGATFILGKLQESVSTITAEITGSKFALSSASPGIILAILGTSLMITTLIAHHNIHTSQIAIYIHDTWEQGEESREIPPPLPFPDSTDSSTHSNQ